MVMMKKKTIKKRIAEFLVVMIDAFVKVLGVRFYAFFLDHVGRTLNHFGRSAIIISLLGFSVDEFIEVFFPAILEYIKIDVDGIEEKILISAKRTLADPRLRSVLIEGDESKSDQLEMIKDIMTNSAFRLVGSYRSPLFPNSTTQNYRVDR